MEKKSTYKKPKCKTWSEKEKAVSKLIECATNEQNQDPLWQVETVVEINVEGLPHPSQHAD